MHFTPKKPNGTAKIAIRIPAWLGYGREIYQGVGDYIRRHRLKWKVHTEVNTDDEVKARKITKRWRGDGAILFRYTSEEVEKFRKRNIPIVSVSRVSQDPLVPRIHVDNHSVGRLAAEHFIGLGAKHLACVIDSNRNYCHERLEGLREIADQHHREVIVLDAPSSLIPKKNRWEEIQKLMKQHLGSLPEQSAVLARDDISATALMHAADELGISIPQDLAVLGVGDDPILGCINSPGLSSIIIPGKKIGWHAARMLHQQIDHGRCEETAHTIPADHLVQRSSTARIFSDDPIVTRACQLIHTQIKETSFSVQKLCAELNISSTSLLEKFKTHFDLSPKQYIDKTRHTEAVRLVTTTDWSVKQISYELGFRSPEEFDRFFKRHAGISPGRYREQE